jgi:hypothetical protein
LAAIGPPESGKIIIYPLFSDKDWCLFLSTQSRNVPFSVK